MATVLMLGSPPPAKPYRHPLSARASVLTAPAPNRGIEHRRRVHHDHRKLKTSPLLREIHAGARRYPLGIEFGAAARQQDRKSTRLNSSHGYISYAVFCLKKKKNKYIDMLKAESVHSTIRAALCHDM